MSEEKRKRKTQYECGSEETGRNLLLLVLSMMDAYPNLPSPATLKMLDTDLEKYSLVSEAIDRFAKRVSKESRRKPEAVA